jgi:hypothetical protein
MMTDDKKPERSNAIKARECTSALVITTATISSFSPRGGSLPKYQFYQSNGTHLIYIMILVNFRNITHFFGLKWGEE